ncbi:MAG: RluA family pseudouridine synthase [Candidatus Omnitrophica bacterium]|nr:RluA family pseudouridine synthase [Candidatus Omnitrophota bacterium]
MNKNIPPKIFFEDPHLLVLSKPAGMLSQGDESGDENLVDWLRQYLGRNYVGLVHRLDRNTSGIMVVAKRTKAAGRLTEALQKGAIRRIYLAWLEGKLEKPQTWKHWLVKNSQTNEVRAVKAGHPEAKEAILSVTPVEQCIFKEEPLTLAEFVLETGRSHQIRVQSAAAGFPVVGDPKYGKPNRNLSSLFKRPALHSCRIIFPHPMSQEIMSYEAELPQDFRQAAEVFQKVNKPHV